MMTPSQKGPRPWGLLVWLHYLSGERPRALRALLFSSPEQSSGWTIRILGFPASVVVRASVRPCVRPCVRQQFVYTLENTVLVQSWSNLLRMLVLTKSRPSSILGHVGSKSRSLGQISEKACYHSRDHIFYPILFKLAQNDCLDKI